MKVENSLILQAALSYGADDIAIVSADNETKQSIIVLFSRYFDTPQPQEGYMGSSPYYTASNRGYMAAKRLTEHLTSLGAVAKHHHPAEPQTTGVHAAHLAESDCAPIASP